MSKKQNKVQVEILDEFGNLSMEALIAFASGELDEAQSLEVKKLVEEEEMYADALEGIMAMKSPKNVTDTVGTINQMINEKTGSVQRAVIPSNVWRIAASVLLFVGLSGGIIYVVFNTNISENLAWNSDSETKELAENQVKEDELEKNNEVVSKSETAPATYQWADSTGTASINDLEPGTYTVTVTGTDGTTAMSEFEIPAEAEPISSEEFFNQTHGNAEMTIEEEISGEFSNKDDNYVFSLDGNASHDYQTTISENENFKQPSLKTNPNVPQINNQQPIVYDPNIGFGAYNLNKNERTAGDIGIGIAQPSGSVTTTTGANGGSLAKTPSKEFNLVADLDVDDMADAEEPAMNIDLDNKSIELDKYLIEEKQKKQEDKKRDEAEAKQMAELAAAEEKAIAKYARESEARKMEEEKRLADEKVAEESRLAEEKRFAEGKAKELLAQREKEELEVEAERRANPKSSSGKAKYRASSTSERQQAQAPSADGVSDMLDSVDGNFGYSGSNQAQFPGGEAALRKYISENISYPQYAKDIKKEGTVYVSFVVDENGKITNAKVSRSVLKIMDNEALRVVKSMPNWNPAVVNGNKVPTQMVVPVEFKLKN